ncbi:MAG: NADH-quinone oxidoreductase subunit NuoE [Candidatus Brocadiaceae bacterium]|nr:NADH-quinone oxidoreductase subunit NuoE [Candidatus Brocadiaceae bacterium]
MQNTATTNKESASAVDLTKCQSILAQYTQATISDLIPILQLVQDAYGYLPMEAIEEVSAQTCIPLSKFYGVVTFYSQFHLEPRGKHNIKLCTGTACHIKGAPDIDKKITEVLDIRVGATTQDYKFTYNTAACLGTCFLAPVMMIDDRYYGKLDEEKTENILRSY